MVVILKMDPRCADLAHTGVNFRDFGPHRENGPQMRRLVAWRALPLRCGGGPENGPRLGVVAVEFWTPDVTFCHHPPMGFSGGGCGGGDRADGIGLTAQQRHICTMAAGG